MGRMCQMRSVLILAGLLLVMITAPFAHADKRSETAIHEVISRQLDAIKKDDAGGAFAIASPNIQTMFGNPATFMSMVQRGYPQIYRSVAHKFLNVDTSGGKLMQRVLIESENGAVVVRYEMIEIDGVWRINDSVARAQG